MRLFQLFLFVLMLQVSAEVHSQFELKVVRKEFKKEDEGFKEAWKAIREGNRLYLKGPGLYRNAREKYLKANSYNSENAELNYMIGKCYLYTDDKFEAINYISKAFELNPDVNFDIHLLLGMAFHQVHEFERAIAEYERFLRGLEKKYKEYYFKHVGTLIRQCEHGIELVREPQRVVINNVGREINSVYDDYTPFIDTTEETIYFTSRRKLELDSKRSVLDSKYFEDVYYSTYKDKKWSRARRVSGKINTKKNVDNIAIVGLSPDKRKIYLYKGKENNGDLFVSELKKGEYKKPKPVKKVNSKYREMSICFNSDESTMYFVTNNKKTGYGGMDIYFSEKDSKGRWGKPKNLGSVINTFQDELGISLSADDSTLYFSSKGHNSMGGYDVFKSVLDPHGVWSTPENLGYPVNTPNDDVFYQPIGDGKKAYYATNREAGYGGMDIFKLTYLGAEKQFHMAEIEIPILGVIKPYDDIYFQQSQAVDIDSTYTVYGTVTDSENEKPIISKIEFIDNDLNKVIATVMSDDLGNYKAQLPLPKKYGVEIIATGYLLYLDIVDLSAIPRDDALQKDFKLDRVEVGAKVILKNIYFETGKSTLKAESYASLNNVVKLLEANTGVNIEISGHTDNVGSMKSNLKLSNARAKAVVDYLIGQGIAESRLTHKGYAFNQPIAPNTTAEGRALNRRVEFKITSK
ncbi:MAG: OmpA family protein [Bacteroidales bacterium]|nr:OmpA family protein [Bacteroidales bacterium]